MTHGLDLSHKQEGQAQTEEIEMFQVINIHTDGTETPVSVPMSYSEAAAEYERIVSTWFIWTHYEANGTTLEIRAA